jgi:exopolyphosphatase/guanosine-5'-triphosphate,3'-diphosphate pyrophosphatase
MNNKLEQVREEAVELLIRKYENEPSHVRQVTKLALKIFDCLKGKLHSYGEYERNLLKYGSLLHDTGYYIEAEKHNKHAYKLIMQEKMAGIMPEEKEIIANIARYHRGGTPKNKHKNFAEIVKKSDKDLIRALSAMVRIADGLDRSHTDAIKEIDCTICQDTRQCTFILTPRSINIPAELYGANKKKNLFEDYFGVDVSFTIQHKI